MAKSSKVVTIPLIVIRRCVEERGAVLSRVVPWISSETNFDITHFRGDPEDWDWSDLNMVAHDLGLLFQYPDAEVERDEVCEDEFVSFLYILKLHGNEANYFSALVQTIDDPREVADVFSGMESLVAIGKHLAGDHLTCEMIGLLLTQVAQLNIPKVIPFGTTELECYKQYSSRGEIS